MECIWLCAWHILFDRAEALTNLVSLCMWLVNAGHYSPGYVSMGGTQEAYGIVVVFVCLSVCVLFCSALFSKTATNFTKIAMQLQLNILSPLNWLDFHFKALLSSYSAMAHLDGHCQWSRVQWKVSYSQQTSFALKAPSVPQDRRWP